MHKSQKGFAPIIIILIVLIVLAAGGTGYVVYSGMKKQKEQVKQTTETSQQPVANTQKSESPVTQDSTAQQQATTAQESIQDIFTKAKNIESVYYESFATTTSDGPLGVQSTSMTIARIWQRLPHLTRTDHLMSSSSVETMISRDSNLYYLTEQGKYIEMSSGANTKPSAQVLLTVAGLGDIIKLGDIISKYATIQTLGVETIDGKKATIIEYTMPSFNNIAVKGKIWVWNEKGIPLKMESPVGHGQWAATTTVEVMHFSFDPIPDSVFDVPTDKIINLPIGN